LEESPDGTMRERCEICDAEDLSLAHPAQLLTDLNNPDNLTCWVSEPTTTTTNISPLNVTLTLNLGKKFEVFFVFIILFLIFKRIIRKWIYFFNFKR